MGIIRLSAEKNKEINSTIEQFVQALEDGFSYYHMNRNASKMAKDTFLGKKAEFVVAMTFDIEDTLDIDIREGSKKGWQEDLVLKGKKLHVKCCNENTVKFCGDKSWTFQFSNKYDIYGRDPLLGEKADEDLICLTYMKSEEDSELEICYMGEWGKIKDELKDPVSNKLKGIKKCIYLNDIK